MILIADLIIALAISQLTLLCLSILIFQHGRTAHFISAFSFCLIAYLILNLSMLSGGTTASYVLGRFATLMPFFLWLIAFYFFAEGRKVPQVLLILMIAFVVVRAIGVPLYDPAAEWSSFWFFVIYFLPQLILLGFSVHCVYLAFNDYKTDLLEQRRRARVFFIMGMGIILVVVVGNGFFTFIDPFLDRIPLFSITPVPDIVFPFFILVLTLGFNLTLFRFSDDTIALIPATAKSSNENISGKASRRKSDLVLLDKVVKAMEHDKLYEESGLTIAELAKTLSIQEYQLRRVINRELNYRNFNQFLNHYRIIDSCNRLVDIDLIQNSIASIALDVGFSSLSSFNKAFKDIKGVTPSSYRNSGMSEPAQLQVRSN